MHLGGLGYTIENADAVLIPQVVRLIVIHIRSVTLTQIEAFHMLCPLVFVQVRLTLVGPPGAFALLLSLIMQNAVERATALILK